MKVDHIAVVLRGHVRTWHYIYPMVFDFYDSIANNVDYYFITWERSNTDGVVETFKHQNLVHFQIVSPEVCDTEYYNSFTSPAFMGALLLPHIRATEKKLKNNTKKYDIIFDSRPDVLPERVKINHGDNAEEYLPFILPEENTVNITGIEIHNNQIDPGHHPKGQLPDVAIQDWLIMFTSASFEHLIERYLFRNTLASYDLPGSQIQYRQWIEEHNVNLCTMDWINCDMIRPSCFEIGWESRNDYSTIVEYSKKWLELDSETKTELCTKYGVSLSDYADTPSVTCKI